MITAYLNPRKPTPEIITKDNYSLLQQAIWIDLLFPTKEEETLMEQSLHLSIPTREEMQEIEPSSRLYKEDKSIYMTATMIAKSDTLSPISDAITIVIKGEKLITIRYIEPQAFATFTSRIARLPSENQSATFLMIELLEAAIDRLADITERVGKEFDAYSATVFRKQDHDPSKLDYKDLLKSLGLNGDLNSKVWKVWQALIDWVFFLIRQ